jgi:hypothetical protein
MTRTLVGKMTNELKLQDACFYVNENGHEIVWRDDENPRFFVVRNGELRLHAWAKGEDEKNPTVIRYTDQLESYGINTDEELQKAFGLRGEAKYEWAYNPWFEVWDTEQTEEDGESYHSLSDAVKIAEQMNAEQNK